MSHYLPRLMGIVLAFLCTCMGDWSQSWQWNLPDHFPSPKVPSHNAMSQPKVDFGRYLFYDTRLSVTGDTSCASCHEQKKAFSDGLALAKGATGQMHPRGSMSLTNVVYASRLTWANPSINSLEFQALLPMFGEDPVEMGLSAVEEQVLLTLREDPSYQNLFKKAFPDEKGPLTYHHITQSIASFERTLISSNSPYDLFIAGDNNALSAEAKRGMELFYSERLECFHCHGGFNFSDSVDHDGLVDAEVGFHNTGLYNLDETGAYPATNEGIKEITGKSKDMGRFKAPTLRNIAVTAPYFHDGSATTLEEAISHYERGGRLSSEAGLVGDGQKNPLKSTFVSGFIITSSERKDLLAFLSSLTDKTFLNNPDYSDPWKSPMNNLQPAKIR